MAQQTPTLARRTLGSMVKKLRERAGVHVNDAAVRAGVDRTTLQRWERGQTAPKAGILPTLGHLYGASSAEIARLTSLAEQSSRRGIWESARISPELRALYEAEATAVDISAIELDLIPGLAQTISYVRTVQGVLKPVAPEVQQAVERQWAQRQQLVFGDPVPRIRLAFGRSALQYLDEAPAVREEQTKRLRMLNALPSVEIRVITRLHAAMVGPFTVLTPGAEGFASPFLFVEAADGCRYVEDRDVVSHHQVIFDMVWTRSTTSLEEYLK